MNYDREILRILVEVGDEGLSVQKISRHVFNACNSFFHPIRYTDVHHYVAQFLLRNSKSTGSMIEKAERGIYHLNMKNTKSQQLMLEFKDTTSENALQPPSEDLSLSLFD